MNKRKPVDQFNLIEKEYRNYIKSTFTLNDEKFNDAFEKELNNVEIAKGPYLNKMLPFVPGKSIRQLVEEEKLNKEFFKLNKIDFNRPLYQHQIDSLNKIAEGRSIVVTTGTGSGKTESFLYPIINHILNDSEIDKPGVRAVFLFPMNALVNDQMKRIREILCNYPKIKFGRYVGDTEDNINPDAERKRLKRIYGYDIPSNELVTREEIRSNQPHLLFTNYSMLEYLLLRPKDNSILCEDNTTKWQFIVLDEAHTYSGALGIEVGMLLRRLQERICRKPQFILTSATLGEQNKDEEDIVNFAQNLTGASYSKEDIIFSKRKQLPESGIYRVDGKDYSNIKDILVDYNNDKDNKTKYFDKIKNITKKYTNDENNTIVDLLHNLLIKDGNTLLLNKILDSKPLTFDEVYKYFKIFKMSENNFSDLVYIISFVFSEKKELFDIKYHSFVRTIDGCFVTLNNDRKISLKRCLKINEFYAFEIGKCKKCDEVFIIGKIERNKLRQNSDIDIYENETNEQSPVDYFIFDENVEEFDNEYLEMHKLCVKCGNIYDADETHPSDCFCGSEHLKTIYRVKKDKNESKNQINALYNNNITYCPCCRKSNNTGIVSSFYLGKDATTSVLTQILLKAIDIVDDQHEEIDEQLFDDNPFLVEEERKNNKDYVKQLIQFSDGRQQASFAAIFSDYNHERFLRKKLLYDACKDSESPLSFSRLKSLLENQIENYNLFQNKYSEEANGSSKNAWITILNELLNIDGNNSAEGLGLFAFKLDLSKIEQGKKYINNIFEKNGICDYTLKIEEFLDILSVITNIFRNTPAIEYNDSELSIEDKKEEFSYRMYDNYIMLQKEKHQIIKNFAGKVITNNVRSLLPVNIGQSNKIINYVMACTGYELEKAKRFIWICFNDILKTTKIIEECNAIDCYKINANKYKLFGEKQLKWYRCKKCKSVTIYNCRNICPSCSESSLELCDPNEIFEGNYYRNEYKNKKVEKLVFKEHTGQLTAEQGLKIQRDFIDKKVNVLSCSTTFEMGVDIGSLETVFMRNVPPSPANYVQRAGRAGRGKDSSAFVITFCGVSSHDYYYFSTPEKMISGKIKPPMFKMDNKKIVIRHIMDTALSFYLRLFENDFSNIGSFMNNYYNFENYLKSKPSELNYFINSFIKDTELIEYRNFGWLDEVIGENGIIKKYYDHFISEKKELEKLSLYEIKEGNDKIAAYYDGEIAKMEKMEFIKAMANYNIIPKYGFPVDTINLKTPTQQDKVDLSRDLQIAISEYAPDCEVVADGKKYTSRYIIIPRNKEITKYYYLKCKSCGKTIYNIDKSKLLLCDVCFAELKLEENRPKCFICPTYGFKADFKTVTSKTIKPKKSYSNEIEYLGKGINEFTFDFKDYIKVYSNKNDELLVLNTNPFFMCDKCGYTIMDKDNKGTLRKKLQEEGHSDGIKKCENTHLREISLGYYFKTDVIKIEFKKHLQFHEALSFLYAFLDGISFTFSIERKDIDGVVALEKNSTYSVVVFDAVPGGAGYVKNLMNEKNLALVLNDTLKNISSCTCDVETSCYNCLRNYKNQRHHRFLKRSSAMKVINDILCHNK